MPSCSFSTLETLQKIPTHQLFIEQRVNLPEMYCRFYIDPWHLLASTIQSNAYLNIIKTLSQKYNKTVKHNMPDLPSIETASILYIIYEQCALLDLRLSLHTHRWHLLPAC